MGKLIRRKGYRRSCSVDDLFCLAGQTFAELLTDAGEEFVNFIRRQMAHTRVNVDGLLLG